MLVSSVVRMGCGSVVQPTSVGSGAGLAGAVSDGCRLCHRWAVATRGRPDTPRANMNRGGQGCGTDRHEASLFGWRTGWGLT